MNEGPLRLGIIPVAIDVIEQIFCLPKGYSIVACHYSEIERIINFTVMSDDLPEVSHGCWLPRLKVAFRVETLPDQSPEYKRITAEVKRI